MFENFNYFRYYMVPPAIPDCQISARIVTEEAKEFDIENFEVEEKMVLDGLEVEKASQKLAIEPLQIQDWTL